VVGQCTDGRNRCRIDSPGCHVAPNSVTISVPFESIVASRSLSVRHGTL